MKTDATPPNNPKRTLLLLGCLLGSSLVGAQSLASLRPPPDVYQTQPGQARTLRDVLQEIKQQYGVNFVCKGDLLDNKTAGLPGGRDKQRVETVLKAVLEPLNLSFSKMDNKVYLILRKEDNGPEPAKGELPGPESRLNDDSTGAGFRSLSGSRIDVDVRGKVTDDKDEPLVGVNVTVKGTTLGTTSNPDGTYRLSVPEGSTLVFSFIGYAPEEVALGNRTTIDVRLVADIKSLQEVVVVGYGQRKKANYTGSVASIDSKELLQAPVANVGNALVGRLPGLVGVQRSGEPGSDGSQLLIRGLSTTGDSNPLVVVDGIPRDFTQIDPNEIETITVLKDAASAAVFGVRGANGVILVTTKRGKAGKTSLSLSARTDFQSPTRMPEFLGSYDMAVLLNEARRNSGEAELYSPEALEAFRTGSNPDVYPNTDWAKETLKPYAPQQQYNLSLSGGGEKVRYFVSAGYLNQKGLYDANFFKRYNFRSNIDVDATPTTRLSVDVSGRVEDRNYPGQAANQLFMSIMRNQPTAVAYFANGLPGNYIGQNPAEEARNSGYLRRVNNVLLGNLVVTQQLPFVSGLSLKGVFAADRSYLNEKHWTLPITLYNYNANTDAYTSVRKGADPALNERFDQYSSLTAEAHLNYARTFGRHDLGALVLYTQTHYQANGISARRVNYSFSSVDQIFAGPGANQTNNGSADERARRGYVGRLTYAYDSRYLFEANFRVDGSENFPARSRWGFFPSLSAGWRVSEERFFREALPLFDNLKVRASWGQLGNDALLDESRNPQRFAYLASYGFGNPYAFNNQLVQSIREGRLPSTFITWEKAVNTNVGLEGSLWRGLLGFEVDYFYKRTRDILAPRNLSVPATVGATLPFENIGIVDNRGFEVVLSHRNTLGPVGYLVGGNVTFAKNKIVEIDEPENVNPNLRRTGRPIGQYFGYRAIGLFGADDLADAPGQPNAVSAGDIRYADTNGDG
ncbi:MAG: TonB-dependent receptor, partial [Cytophagales bacterium]|nr:TonB-dependent receptor [Cytophagales bacterium]